MPRLRLPNPPLRESRPLTVAEFRGCHESDDAHGTLVTWTLALIRYSTGTRTARHEPREKTGEWLNLKLYASDRVPHKANYWLAWHPSRREMSLTKDRSRLREHRPKLYDIVSEYLTQFGDELQSVIAYHIVEATPVGGCVMRADPFNALLHAGTLKPPVARDAWPHHELDRALTLLREERGVQFRRIDDSLLGVLLARSDA